MSLSRLNTLSGACLSVLLGVAIANGEEPRDGILFRASFDSFSTVADKAVNTAASGEGIASDLQFRMYPDVSGGKGNALTLTVPEYVAWPAAGNIHPDRGTVSLWVKPCNYTLADGKMYQIFFQAVTPGHFEFIIYKYAPWSNSIMVFMRTPKERYIVRGAAQWKEGEWHKLDVAWDPNRLSLYIDGREPGHVFDHAPNIEITPPMSSFPKSLSGGIMALGYPKNWNSLKEGRITAFDDLEIRDRPMSAKEVFEAFAAKRPDLAKNAPALKEDARDPVKLTYRCIPAEKKLQVRLDFDAVDLPSTTNIQVRLKLADKADGDVAANMDAVFANSDATVDLPFGSSLKPGHDYELSAAITGTKYVSRATLRVPDPPPAGPRAGVDHEVPYPWTPVKHERELVFSVLDRTYAFEDGVIPSSIVSRGQEQFAQAPALELDGEKVRWGKARIISRTDESAVLEADGSSGVLAFKGCAKLWFDGFCEIELSMVSPERRDVQLHSLRLKWAVPRDAARYLLTPAYTPWEGDKFERFLGFDFNDCSLLWTTGVEKGLAWWRGSDANWIVNRQKRNLRVERDATMAKVEVDIIGRGAILRSGAKASYVMGFQGTPARRPDRSYRVMNYGEPGNEGATWTMISTRSNSKIHSCDNMRGASFVPMRPGAFGKLLEDRRKIGMDNVVYSMPAHICTFDRTWDYWYDTWVRHPGTRWSCFDENTGDKSCLMPCCGHTGAADIQLANAKKLFEDFPLLKGLYFDIANVEWCDNELHGHGGTDAFGQKIRSSIAMSLREFFMRAGKICRAYGRHLHVHAHNKYFPFVHDFADACWPGEEKFYPFMKDPRHLYVEGISAEEYESAWNTDIRGMGIFMIAQNARAKSLLPEQVAKDPDAFFARDGVRRTFMPSLFYDFSCMGMFGEGQPYVLEIWKALKPLAMNKATFHPGWTEPAVALAPGLRTALYTWRKGDGHVPFLLAVGNFSREDKPTAAKIDWSRIGTAPSSLVDIQTGRTFTEDELAAFVLRSHDFLLLTPTAKSIE